jgi:hypothetical protein
MKRLMLLLAISLISTNVGCTLCSNCDDSTYGAFGGLWERSDLSYGRVGTTFAPDGSIIAGWESTQPQNQDSAVPQLADPDVEELVRPPVDDARPLSDAEEDLLLDT